MYIKIITVGTKMPEWVQIGCSEYLKRIPKELNVHLIEIPMAQRTKTTEISRAIAKEGEAMLKAIETNDKVIALDLNGKYWKTEELAKNIQDWRQSGNNFSLLIGGPDGIAQSCMKRADKLWSLSPLTLPHTFVRILLTEQIYRASTINAGHPYHR